MFNYLLSLIFQRSTFLSPVQESAGKDYFPIVQSDKRIMDKMDE